MAVAAPLSPLAPSFGKGRSERIVAALDVGTSKVASLIAIVGPEGEPRVIGAGVRACNGMRRGLVADMNKTELAIRAAMGQAEKAAGVGIESVVVAMSSGGLESMITSVEIDIAGQRIAEADMATLMEAARLRIDETSREEGRSILHAEPTLYVVDCLDGITDPRGFHANRLAVDIHVLTASTPPCRNLDLAVRNAHLDVEAIIASGAAASIGVLGDEERELGVALVEIGAGVTTVTVHAGGKLVGLASIPVGSGDITADIASTFGTRRAVAERLKTLSGAAIAAPRDNHEFLEAPPLVDDGQEPRRIAKAELIAVITARLAHIFREVDRVLRDIGFTGTAGRQVVLTGGGAELRGIADYAQSALDRNVRVGRPQGLAALPEAQASAAFATLAGLVLYQSRPRFDLARLPVRSRRDEPLNERSASPIVRLFRQLKRQI